MIDAIGTGMIDGIGTGMIDVTGTEIDGIGTETIGGDTSAVWIEIGR